MKRLAFASVLIAAVVGTYQAISMLGRAACRNTPIQTLLSPDGALKAVLFTRDCGATTGPSSQVSVIPGADDLPNDPGTIFIADLPQGENAATWGGRMWNWLGAHRKAWNCSTSGLPGYSGSAKRSPVSAYRTVSEPSGENPRMQGIRSQCA